MEYVSRKLNKRDNANKVNSEMRVVYVSITVTDTEWMKIRKTKDFK